MSELRFEDILINAGTDKFDRMTGYVEFPYFHKQIEVICDKGVTEECAARSIQWLADVDEALVREICQYALYYLQDELESTSKGELYLGGSMDKAGGHPPDDSMAWQEQTAAKRISLCKNGVQSIRKK